MSSALTQTVKPNIFRRAGKSVIEYVKHVANDYKTVVIETFEDIPKHPIRSTIFVSTLGTIITAVCTNPTETQMWNRIAEWRIQMGLVPNSIHNTAAVYAAQDPNLKDWPWNIFLKDVIDIGAFNRFWLLEKQFIDYDIRKEEFPEEEQKKLAS
uniref:Uncharacterized protein n=1 Tax=Panagrolaimus sp. PS1159 TaxID=55785 RepID=A0AC35FBZ5_9BILA